jgi:hypothetical protein
MTKQPNCGFLILDRKGEYIKDTIDQRGNAVFGLHHHPKAPERMVVVSRKDYSGLKNRGLIFNYLQPQFNIKDIDPGDLVDFLPGLTQPQADLLQDYAHIERFYEKLLAETQFGATNKRNWYNDFPGLFDMKDAGKKLLQKFEEDATLGNRDELLDNEREQLQEYLTGTKSGLLERAAAKIKRFCLNPFFGTSERGTIALKSPSCVDLILKYLAEGRFVFIDMLGQSDENYTMVAALFARRLLSWNKAQDDDKKHIRACLVMEEAHNILSEEELRKGNGRGSVFIELAREGRSFKLGFVLVTQQPDVKSIDLQVVKTIDSVVAFNMPFDDAKHIQRLKSGFAGLELEISNAPEFRGVAIADAGPIFFQSSPVDDTYMKLCAEGLLEDAIENRRGAESIVDVRAADEQKPAVSSIEDRLTSLMRKRQETIHEVALATMQAWREKDESMPIDEAD